MADDEFSNPAAGGKFSAESHNGKLLIVTPTDFVKDKPTTFGNKDAVEATIVVVDEIKPADSEVIEGALLFGMVLIGQTKSQINKGRILGRLGQGTAKPGQKPPWRLDDPTDADKAKAREYLASVAPPF